MHIPNKPRKYGIKVMLLADARNQFAYNGYIYAEKDTDGVGLSVSVKKNSKPSQSVIRLAKPIYGTNRNITTDNWFSSVELVTLLKPNGLTYVGTMRKSKRDIPPKFLANREREVRSTVYGFTKDMTLERYCIQTVFT
jgi:hypothetical protein